MEKIKKSLEIIFYRLFIHNFKLKILSLFVSFLLWLNITAKEMVRVDTLKSVEVRNIPKDFEIKKVEPKFVKVVLEGQRMYINSINYININIYVDASDIKEGKNILPIKIENPPSNSNINIVSVDPDKVLVIAKKRIQKRKNNKLKKDFN